MMLLAGVLCLLVNASGAGENVPAPVIVGPWNTIATNPDLGPLTSEKQQPVDFGLWRAADGTWQLWSCVRSTRERARLDSFSGGKERAWMWARGNPRGSQ